MRIAWRIREKILLSAAILVVVVSILSYSSFHGAALFRGLTKSIRARASELPLAATLGHKVSQLRITFLRFSLYNQIRSRRGPGDMTSIIGLTDRGFVDDEISLRQEFLLDLERVKLSLDDYKMELSNSLVDGRMLSDVGREMSTVEEIEQILARIATDFARADWVFSVNNRAVLSQALVQLQEQVTLLPGFLSQRMDAFHEQARAEYKTWMFLSGMMTLAAIGCLILLATGIYFWIFRPLRVLIRGSQQVASGDFSHRIRVCTQDEVADLADAMNQMTENFQLIRNDLDEQVRRRTKEAIRSDRLASVGFLAAGIAHEINNPLASIAWSAESVEKRFDEAFEMEVDADPDVEFIRKYLSRIQTESFRCKGITERLLDFSRVGESERKPLNLTKCIQGVIDMVKNLGKYREKNIWFESGKQIEAEVNGQEIKQVMLNLLTNALDCVEKEGNVWFELEAKMGNVVITVRDDGCGMPPDVLEHIFEPFFTKRKHGEGTGLGLSITHQIIADHGGTIDAISPGPGLGATFEVTLPITQKKTNVPPVAGRLRTANGASGTETDDQKEKEKKRIAA